jgi:predicted dehydrogenase
VIYIATPHVYHFGNTISCLQHNKAVLCEKPFAMNKRQVEKMIETAREKDVFLMEALWTKFLPHYKKTMELIVNETIGKVTCVQANFGFKLEPSSASRLSDSSLGGGTLLDIGIYNIFLALSILGKPDDIKATAKLSANGIDEQCSILFSYKKGATAQLFSTFNATIPVEANIFGTNGNIKLTNRFYEPSSIVQLSTEGKTDYTDLSVEKESGIGYFYEADHVTQCLLQNKKESPLMRFEDSLLLIETLDTIREQIGLKYENE